MWIDVVVDVIIITVMTIDTVTGVSQRPTAATVKVNGETIARTSLQQNPCLDAFYYILILDASSFRMMKTNELHL